MGKIVVLGVALALAAGTAVASPASNMIHAMKAKIVVTNGSDGVGKSSVRTGPKTAGSDGVGK